MKYFGLQLNTQLWETIKITKYHDTSWTVSSWTTQIGRVQPVLEELGTDGPGSVGPESIGAGTDGAESVGPGSVGPGRQQSAVRFWWFRSRK